MTKVVVLFSSNERQFPSNSGRYGLSIQELYDSMPMYHLSLDQCSIHPYSIVQVFEVTSPITFLVVFNYTTTNDGATLSSQDIVLCTQFVNIMDITLIGPWIHSYCTWMLSYHQLLVLGQEEETLSQGGLR